MSETSFFFHVSSINLFLQTGLTSFICSCVVKFSLLNSPWSGLFRFLRDLNSLGLVVNPRSNLLLSGKTLFSS